MKRDRPPVLSDGFVSEPGPFDTMETWVNWLAEVHAWPESNTKTYCIGNAERAIERLKQSSAFLRHGVEWLN